MTIIHTIEGDPTEYTAATLPLTPHMAKWLRQLEALARRGDGEEYGTGSVADGPGPGPDLGLGTGDGVR